MTGVCGRPRGRALSYLPLGLNMPLCNLFFRNGFVEVPRRSLGVNIVAYFYYPPDDKDEFGCDEDISPLQIKRDAKS